MNRLPRQAIHWRALRPEPRNRQVQTIDIEFSHEVLGPVGTFNEADWDDVPFRDGRTVRGALGLHSDVSVRRLARDIPASLPVSSFPLLTVDVHPRMLFVRIAFPPGIDPGPTLRRLPGVPGVESFWLDRGHALPPPQMLAAQVAARLNPIGPQYGPDGLDLPLPASPKVSDTYVVDVEGGWGDHPGLHKPSTDPNQATTARVVQIYGLPVDEVEKEVDRHGEPLHRAYRGHGTAVASQLSGLPVVPGSETLSPTPAPRVRLSSIWQRPTPYLPPERCIACAINAGINWIRTATNDQPTGHIILIEQQVRINGTGPYLPAEVEPSVFSAIADAVTRGIIVVEAAGNGATNLDTLTVGGKRILDRRRGGAGFRNSGAILVGGITSKDRPRLLSGCNYGSRVDCSAWAEDVLAAGNCWDGRERDRKGRVVDWYKDYSDYFGGTSSAAALVAAAIARVQAKLPAGDRLTSQSARELLWSPAVSDEPNARFGVVPEFTTVKSAKTQSQLKDAVEQLKATGSAAFTKHHPHHS